MSCPGLGSQSLTDCVFVCFFRRIAIWGFSSKVFSEQVLCEYSDVGQVGRVGQGRGRSGELLELVKEVHVCGECPFSFCSQFIVQFFSVAASWPAFHCTQEALCSARWGTKPFH